MKINKLLVLLPFILSGCGDSPSDHAHHGEGGAEEIVMPPANPVRVVEGVTVVEMTGNDRMKYNLESFVVSAGSRVKLIFTNRGKMPKSSMGHNVVFLMADADVGAFVTGAASARDNDYIPAALESQILAHTKLLGPGETDTIEFIAPEVLGEYDFLCSFPAHLYAGMRGVMIVE